MHHGEYVAVGNANVTRLVVLDVCVNGLVYCWYIEFVTYVEIFFHLVLSLSPQAPEGWGKCLNVYISSPSELLYIFSPCDAFFTSCPSLSSLC